MNTVVCAIAKYENDYIAEWVRYHIDLGFCHIYIYDNNEIDGERIEDAVPADLKDKVTVIDTRGKKYMQKVVYNECYRTFDFDRCAFIDIDEFITFNPKSGYTDINDYLQDRDDYDAVHLNWMCYGDNGIVRKKDGNVVDRFKEPIMPLDFAFGYDFPQNNHIKSILKKGLDVDWCKDTEDWDSNPHTPYGKMRICDERGNTVGNSPFHKFSFEFAYIRHYYSKTIEEYTCKMLRQCADCEVKPYTFVTFYSYTGISIRKILMQIALRRKYGFDNKESTVFHTLKLLIKCKHGKFYKGLKRLFRIHG